jgi:hypothetical protein
MQTDPQRLSTAAFNRLGEMRQERRLPTAVRPHDCRRAAKAVQPFEQLVDIDTSARVIERLDATGPRESR